MYVSLQGQPKVNWFKVKISLFILPDGRDYNYELEQIIKKHTSFWVAPS